MLEKDHAFVDEVILSKPMTTNTAIWFVCVNAYLEMYMLQAPHAARSQIEHLDAFRPESTIFEKTAYTLRNVSTHTDCFMISSIRLTIPSSHLSHNVFQCNPRRKHTCTN